MSKSFQVVRLGDVLIPVTRSETVVPEKTYHILGAHWYAKGLYTKDIRNGSQIQAKNLYRVERGDFVYNRLFAWKGSFAVASEENDCCYVSNEFPCFAVNQDRIHSRYLWRYFSRAAVWEEALGLSTGGTPTSRNRLKEEKLLAMEIPLPPVEEQRRIVAKIDALAAEIESVYGLQVKSTQELYFLYDSAVQSICYAGKYPLITFGEVLSEAKNGIYKPPEFWGRGIPCIRMYNIDGPSMNTTNLQLLDVTEDEFSTYSCQSGDLVFNRVNSAELVGKTGIITEKYPKCTFESKNMRLRVNQERVMPEFVAIILNSKKTKEYYRRVLKQQCGMATLNQGHVRNIPFPIPSLLEQDHIVVHIDSLKAKVEEFDNLKVQALADLDALLPSILEKAFKGEL